jgi:Family of unknown function (DUF6166)
MKVYVGVRVPITAERWEKHYGWPRGDAERMAAETANSEETRVYVREREREYELPHFPFHSPSGFEWGYQGSGPAELARCILLDFYGVTPEKRGSYFDPTPGELPVSYQEFKRDFIARLPQHNGFEITAEQIADWAEQVEAGR